MSHPDHHSRAIGYAIGQIGVEIVGDTPLARDPNRGGFHFRMRMPFDAEEVSIGERELYVGVGVVIDKLIAARDRLFARTIAHMAQYDVEIQAILKRQQETARKRDELIKVIEGMASGGAPETTPSGATPALENSP